MANIMDIGISQDQVKDPSFQENLNDFLISLRPTDDKYRLVFGDGVTDIPSFVVKYMDQNTRDSLVGVSFPDSVKTIGDGAFASCRNLEIMHMSNNLEMIGGSAFTHCDSIELDKLPDSVSVIGAMAFEGCEKVALTDIPESLKTLGNKPFVGCTQSAPDIQRLGDWTTLPFYGLNAIDNFNITRAMHEAGVPMTHSSVEHINKILHSDQSHQKGDSYRHDKTLLQALDNFKTYGALPIDSSIKTKQPELFDKTKQSLQQLFEAKFKRAPKVLDALAVQSIALKMPPEKIVNSFDLKRTKEYIDRHIPACVGNTLMSTMNKNDFDKAINSNYIDELATMMAYTTQHNDLDSAQNVLNAALWVIDHPQTNDALHRQVIDKCQSIDIDRSSSIDFVNSELNRVASIAEVEKIESHYPDFHFEDCTTNIKPCEVELGKYKAYVMDSQDPRQAMLGDMTNCCQHLGGAGETAMMYGLASPNAGFFVIEDVESHKIMAQAEAWLTEDKIPIPGDVLDFDDPSLKHDFETWFTDFVNNGWVEACDCSIAEHMNYCMGEDRYNEAVSEDLGTIMITDMDAVLDFIDGNEYAKESFLTYCSEHGFEHDGEEHFLTMTKDGEIRAFEGYTDKESLVFDNIEFADDRQIDQFAPVLGKWLEECSYDNVIMGNGYNEMNIDVTQLGGITPPMTDEYFYSVASEDIVSSINCAEEELCDIGYTSPDDVIDAIIHGNVSYELQEVLSEYDIDVNDIGPYTDSANSCSALKLNGDLEPFLEQALDDELSKDATLTVSIGDNINLEFDSGLVTFINNSDKDVTIDNILKDGQPVKLDLAAGQSLSYPEGFADFKQAHIQDKEPEKSLKIDRDDLTL